MTLWRQIKTNRIWLIVALGIALATPLFIRQAMINLGMLSLSQVFLRGEADSPIGSYPLLNTDRPAPEALRAEEYLRLAEQMSPNVTARWAAGRAALANGHYQEAARLLITLMPEWSDNALAFHDAVIAASLSGNSQTVIDLITENAPRPFSAIISDTLALAYLEQAQMKQGTGDIEAATQLVQQAGALRPYDLFVNQFLSQHAAAHENAPGQDHDWHGLAQFPLAAIEPKNQRLLALATDPMIDLRQVNIWDRAQLKRICDYLVWRHFEWPQVRQMVDAFIQNDPTEADWYLCRGELHQRRGERQEAAADYQAALAIDPDSIQARRQLMLLTGSPRNADGAMGHSPVLDSVINVHQPGNNDVTVGTNLLPIGDFEQVKHGELQSWAIGDYATGNDPAKPRAAYGGGPDGLAAPMGQYSARIDSLWPAAPGSIYGLVSRPSAESGTYSVEIMPQQLYWISGLFRTASDSEQASIYLGGRTAGIVDEFLPPTGGVWRRFDLLRCLQHDSSEMMQFVLRLQGVGRVWFDDVSIRPVTVPNMPDVCNRLLSNPPQIH